MVKLTTKIASLKLFASYAIATYILVILTSALNLLKVMWLIRSILLKHC